MANALVRRKFGRPGTWLGGPNIAFGKGHLGK